MFETTKESCLKGGRLMINKGSAPQNDCVMRAKDGKGHGRPLLWFNRNRPVTVSDISEL